MYSVILVDDEVFSRKGLRNLIDWEACGFSVTGEADNGEDALAMIRDGKPDLVITDIRMPVMDGLELIRLTREDPALSNMEFIIISGYDDFSYAQKAVRYGVLDFILKPVDEHELEGVLKELAGKLDRSRSAREEQTRLNNERMVSALIRGEAPEAAIGEWAARQGFDADEEIRYVLVEVNDLHPWQDGEQPSPDIIRAAIQSAVREWLKDGRDPYIHVHAKRYGFILPVSRCPEESGGLDRLAAELPQAISRRLSAPVYLYISDPVRHLGLLRDAYQTANTAALHKYACDKCVIIHDRLPDEPLNFASLDPQLVRRLNERVEEGAEEELQPLIETIFHEFRTHRFSPEAVKLAVHACVTEVLGNVKRLDIDPSELDHLPPMLGWQDLCLTPEELKRLFSAFIFECAAKTALKRRDSIKGSIQKIRDYIEAHYHENISLKSIAAIFFMNPVYLGQLFRKTYGMYFNEFLLDIRIREAKKLLRQTDLRIYEIADRVGFKNADYFVTQFEKIENMTPSEYRSKLV